MSDCKYQKLRKYISYDMGATWNAIEPAEYQKGELIEYQSKDCSIIPPKPFIYRWVDTTGYICSGYDKYNRQKKQYSDDSGLSWQDVSPEQYRMGSTLIEANSEDCGYIPPANFKFKATYNNSTTYSAECNSSTTLTSGETHPSTAMTSAVIGDCVTSIGDNAFKYCYSLSSVTISDSVTSIGDNAFYRCSGLTSIDIPSGVTSIGDNAFYYCSSLTSIEIPSGVTSIGSGVFWVCESLTSVTIPSGVTSIGDAAFRNCHSLTSIGTIGSGASVEIPNGVTSIDSSSFSYCSGLTSVTIHSGITSIYSYALQGCTNLQNITILSTTPPTLYGAGTFADTNDCPIYVPSGSVNAYKTARYWSDYASRIQAIP